MLIGSLLFPLSMSILTQDKKPSTLSLRIVFSGVIGSRSQKVLLPVPSAAHGLNQPFLSHWLCRSLHRTVQSHGTSTARSLPTITLRTPGEMARIRCTKYARYQTCDCFSPSGLEPLLTRAMGV